MINGTRKDRNFITYIPVETKEVVIAYIKGAVYCWCKNFTFDNGAGSKPFAVRDLFGGTNTLWYDTPLQKIYESRFEKNPETAYSEAGKDLGKLLYETLFNDKRRIYEESKDEMVNIYRWTGEEIPENQVAGQQG